MGPTRGKEANKQLANKRNLWGHRSDYSEEGDQDE